MILEILNKIKFWKSADRIGPEIPYTHWRLYFKSTMLKLCKKKFKHFSDSAEFRPGAHAVVCSRISIGERCVVRPGTMLHANPEKDGAGIVIEDDVLIGPAVQIYVDNHNFDDLSTPIINQGHEKAREVILKVGCWVGAGSIILSGVTIGENAVVGAGSVVTKNVPPGVIVVGNPARILREIRNKAIIGNDQQGSVA